MIKCWHFGDPDIAHGIFYDSPCLLDCPVETFEKCMEGYLYDKNHGCTVRRIKQ